ncbi:cryptochrome/photolyase family protein [Sphingomonas turrisvirgatae]|uniref:Deoxyribodipyrimidine photolyase n=1 Tax=Sphingomonas turrisvirgatae TaxID=1888892 RepID=A0A1E3LVG2_9SPHN|nr:deoxyribodipyrimidine photo-lyase [Sphingomonas turrisvirgatae]ODP36830.1 deoxyribodipyrimidine photolyase [Sphingomonas turrisvirgatae]
MVNPVILWLRQDLRLHDQPALVSAAQAGPVIPVYVLDDEAPGRWRMGAAQRWWLHHALNALGEALAAKGSRLILRRGSAVRELQKLADETGASAIHAIRHYEPWWIDAEEKLGERLCLHDGNHLAPLRDVTTGSGGQFKIYSAFWRALSERMPPEKPLPVPHSLPAPDHWPSSEKLSGWDLLPTNPNWATGFAPDWTPGEAEALRKAKDFAEEVGDYPARRDMPAVEGTSRLSPHLHFGEISPRSLWHALGSGANAAKFHKELAWRDFTSSLLLAMPDYGDRNGRPAFDKLKWRKSAADLKAWQQGCTGYPIVDAGMRQLWTTGWMHNRVRMIAASFLIKHLLIDWREGERWFWDTLVDADYGNNSVNWQWVAGTGVDSNMWGRIMAPLGQSEKFDAGDYIRQWVPELRDVSDAQIHDPEDRPNGYPEKIIGHREARERALAAGRAIR